MICARFAFLAGLSLTALGLVAESTAVETPSLHGHLRYEGFAYPDSDRSGDSWENFAEVRLRGRGTLSDDLTYRFEAMAFADTVHFTSGVYSVRNESRRRAHTNLISAVLDYRPSDGVRLSIGRQLVNWSIFDQIQPANVTSTSDVSDPFREVDIGVYSVAAHWEHEFGEVDVLVVPFAFAPTRLPQGRWNIIREDDVDKVQDLPSAHADETQAAMRLGFSIDLLEVGLIGYIGRDTSAVFIPELTFVGGEDRFELSIIDRYPRIRAGGFNVSYPLLDTLLARTEVMYFTSPEEYQDDFVHIAIGGEYSIGDVRFVLNYLREEITKNAANEVTDKGQRRFFRSFIFGVLSYDAGDRLRLRMRGGYDERGDFMILRPEVSYRVWRDIRVRLSGDVIDSKRDTDRYFDRIRHEDRWGIAVTQYF